MFVATIYALFAADILEATTGRSAELPFAWGSLVCFLLFLVEWVALIVAKDEYPCSFFFVLDGAPLPTINTVADWNNFDDSITAIGAATGPFAPGQSIRWTELDGHSLTEDDELYGTNGKDVLSGGKGDDYFVSSKGADTYKGGKGYDQVAFHINDPAGVTVELCGRLAGDPTGTGGLDPQREGVATRIQPAEALGID